MATIELLLKAELGKREIVVAKCIFGCVETDAES